MPSLPATTIIEDIVASVVTTLQDVTEANGYDITLSPERALPRGNEWDDGKVVVWLGSDVLDEQKIQWDYRTATINVRFCATVEDTTEASVLLDSRLNLIRGYIEYALTVDKTSRQRDGKAIETFPPDYEALPREIDANIGYGDLSFPIKYRHRLGNPFSQSSD